MGNRKANIQAALVLLKECLDVKQVATLYESTPVGFVNQENFYNTALEAETDLSPLELLKLINDIERKVGRIKRFVNGPREIDVDIIFFDDLIIKDSTLEIPHPRMHERDFVLKPLVELDSRLIHPVFNVTVDQLLRSLPKNSASILKIITND